MSVVLANADIKSVLLNSIENVAFLENVSMKTNFDLQEGSSIANPGKNPCVVKQEASLSVGLFSNSAVACRVSNLDFTVLTIGALDVYAYTKSVNFNLLYDLVDGSGAGDRWKKNQVVKKHYTAEATLIIPAAANSIKSLMDKMLGALTGIEVATALTLNGVAISLPMKMHDIEHTGDQSAMQMFKVMLEGSAPAIGVQYPTSPAGTTTLLETAFNLPNGPANVPYPVVLDMGNANGLKYSGSFVYKSVGFSIQDGSLVSTKFEWANSGAITDAVGT